MARSITQARGLNRSGEARAARGSITGDAGVLAAGHIGLADIADAAPADAAALEAPAETEAEDDGVSDGPAVDFKAYASFTLAAQTWGAVYATLIAAEDQEIAYLMSGGAVTVAETRGTSYLVKSNMPTDRFLGRLLERGDDYASTVPDLTKSFSERTEVNLSTDLVFESGKSPVDVLGGAGAQRIVTSESHDIVHAAAGNDTVLAGAGADIVWGGAGNDEVAGSDGADQIWGGAGADLLDGQADGDFIVGGSGNDTILGGEGSDALLGGSGADSITGGQGADVLAGGAGADTLVGSDGRDTFVFTELDSSATATENVDTIQDFDRGKDVIDLNGFVEMLTLVEKFKDKPYQLTLEDTHDGSIVRIDIDGDGEADLEITVLTTDKEALTADDFVF